MENPKRDHQPNTQPASSQEGQQSWAVRSNDDDESRHSGPENHDYGAKGDHGDPRLKEMIDGRLKSHPDLDASGITVTVQGGKLILAGSVDSQRSKDAVDGIVEGSGCTEVQNDLQVRVPDGGSSRGKQTE